MPISVIAIILVIPSILSIRSPSKIALRQQQLSLPNHLCRLILRPIPLLRIVQLRIPPGLISPADSRSDILGLAQIVGKKVKTSYFKFYVKVLASISTETT
jgi:hypothetical protein